MQALGRGGTTPSDFTWTQSLSLVIMGMYTWEIFNSMQFDIDLILRRRSFRWPYIPYILCRYGYLGGLITFQIFQYTRIKVDCHALYILSGVLGNIAIGMASMNLAIRTIAVWRRNKLVLLLLAVFGLGQWAVIIRDIFLRNASWDSKKDICSVGPDNENELTILYFPTMVFDLLVLILSTVGLARAGWRLHSSLQAVVFKQGLIYFLLSFTSNIFPSLFALLQLEITLVLCFTFIAAFISVVSSCRLVRELAGFASSENIHLSPNEFHVPRIAQKFVHDDTGSMQMTQKEEINAAEFTTNISIDSISILS